MEADLIARYFTALGAARADVRLGIGDDAALLAVPPGSELVLTTDVLVEGVHFDATSPAQSLGHRALAVNLSDIAAMGAAPAWALLSLNLPGVDEQWLQQFAAGFGALAREEGVALVGGNLSRGPLSITVQLAGTVPVGQALLRTGANVGDLIYVSGTPGDAAQGLKAGAGSELRARFEYPAPRVKLGLALGGIASACIDLSDGLYADLGRLALASDCGAAVAIGQLPVSAGLQRALGSEAWRGVLAGGEDYELLFTVPPQRKAALEQLARTLDFPLTSIGQMQNGAGIVLSRDGNVMHFTHPGFDHFSAS